MKHHVLQLIGSFNQGGSERQAVQLTRLLHASGRFRISVACLNPQGVLRKDVERLNLGEINEYPLTSFYDRHAFAQVRKFAAFLRQHEIDLVHTHDFYTNVFGMVGASLARRKARLASKRETGGLRTPAQRRLELYAFKLAHRIVVNSDAVRRHLIESGLSANKIVTIHNGLESDRFDEVKVSRAAALTILNLPTDKPLRVVTIVANLRHEVKDHPTFLRAASRIKSAVPDAAFVIAGEGELLEPMRALAAELRLRDAVYFVGRCENVRELLAISEVCVLSSIAEGFSNAILEYMAAGRPVVATDVGGAREAIIEGTTGFIVAPQDHAAMAVKIIQLLNDRELAQSMGEQGRLVVREQFAPEAQLRKTEQLYQHLLSGETTQALTEEALFPKRS